ncbi:hypothetical protein P8C59_001602 [Phyllachora maydis]|uniref:Ubiquitin-like protease family profile domain-containing protein n=1 Tax=Phyllachora maydis TaxID=1825666 RepID=A0AAD9HYQ2_9PEZI|nr:hypothetical protein P8C59_001602 [Phyllachora maydis]
MRDMAATPGHHEGLEAGARLRRQSPLPNSRSGGRSGSDPAGTPQSSSSDEQFPLASDPEVAPVPATSAAHARDSASRPAANAATGPKKSTWNILERYNSSASSLPDYGPKTPKKMAVIEEFKKGLNEGEFLNDDLIGFGLQHLFSAGKARDKSLEDRVFIHNSFFYQKLKSTGSRINYDGVRSWTARKDILKCDYIVVPVNENYHWWVAIICHPGKLVADAVPQVEEATVDDDAQAEGQGHGSEDKPVNPKNDPQMSESHLQGEPSLPSVAPVNDMRSLSIDSNGDTSNITANQERRGHDHIDIPGEDEDPVTANKVQQASIARKAVRKTGGPGPRKYEFGEPRIITLDSMGNTHSPACQALKQYLVAEFKDKRNQENLNVPQNIGMKALNIPEQKNFSDCGVYLLGYIREFLKDPDVFVQGLLQRVKRDWDFDASELRNDLREQIFELQKEYQKEQKELKKQREQQKKQRPKKRKSPSSVNGTSSAKRRRSPSPQSPYWVSPALPTAARPLTAASVPVVTDCRLVRRKPLESMEVEVSRSPGSEVDEGLSPELPARRSTKVPGTIDLTLE